MATTVPPDRLAALRDFWDLDAATYDRSAGHSPTDLRVTGAWSEALAAALPPAPARVLDAGAGTGFLALAAARLGHRVVAVDLSNGMLEQLSAKAARESLTVECRVRPADDVGPGTFDAVMSRHLLWTLPDPGAALTAWRAAAPDGLLALFDSDWGRTAPAAERLRAAGRRLLRRLRRTAPDHHGHYDEALVAALPFAGGAPVPDVLALVSEAGWPDARVVRLPEVDRAATAALAWPERWLGVPPHHLVTAGRAGAAREALATESHKA